MFDPDYKSVSHSKPSYIKAMTKREIEVARVCQILSNSPYFSVWDAERLAEKIVPPAKTKTVTRPRRVCFRETSCVITHDQSSFVSLWPGSSSGGRSVDLAGLLPRSASNDELRRCLDLIDNPTETVEVEIED